MRGNLSHRGTALGSTIRAHYPGAVSDMRNRHDSVT
jgi:hypothetical protein